MKQNVNSIERTAVFLFLILLILVVYQNCGSPVKINPGIVRKLADADLQALQSLDEAEKRAICESDSFYTCAHEIFNPGRGEGTGTYYTRCLDLEGVADRFCATVSLSSLDEGPAREELRCFNHVIAPNENFPIRSQANDIETAVASVVSHCRQTLKY